MKDRPAIAISRMDRPLPTHRRPRAVITLGFLGALAAASAGGLAYWRYALTSSITVTAGHLTVSTVRRSLFQEYVPVTGSVTPQTIVYLDAVVDGQITKVLVQEGDLVKVGEPLITLKNPTLELSVTSSEAQFAQGTAELANVRLALAQQKVTDQVNLLNETHQLALDQADFNRNAPLVARDYAASGPQSDLTLAIANERALRDVYAAAAAADQANSSAQLAEVNRNIALSEAGLAVAAAQLANLTVKAPIAGQITALNAHVGEAKSNGQQLGEIDGTDAFKIVAEVDQFYLGRVVRGQAATLELDGIIYPLRVAAIDPAVKDDQFKVDLLFTDTKPGSLRTGQTLQPHLLIGDAAPTLVVDNGAFRDDQDQGQVFVLSGANSAVRRDVQLGRENPDLVEVLGGLHAGDRIITSATSDFRNIDRINIISGDTP